MIADSLLGVPVGRGSNLRWAAPSKDPSSNTGPICTSEDRAVSIDTIGCTSVGVLAQDVAEWLGGGFVEGTGRYGYARGLHRGNIGIFWEGHSAAMGVHVAMSGQGCREAEAAGVVDDWPGFIARMRELGFCFTRVDGAIDDFGGYLDLEEMWRKASGGEVVSLFRKARRIQSVDIHDAIGAVEVGQNLRSYRFEHKSLGETVMFGSDKSKAKIRAYNKAAERHARGVDVPDQHWVRVELQARDGKAEELVDAILEHGAAGVAMMIRRHLQFKDPSGDSNKRRWDLSPWWERFLDAVDAFRKLATSEERPESLARKVGWLQKFVAPTFAQVGMAVGGEELLALRLEGESRLKPKQWADLAAWIACGWQDDGKGRTVVRREWLKPGTASMVCLN